jgi:hypothetical protein
MLRVVAIFYELLLALIKEDMRSVEMLFSVFYIHSGSLDSLSGPA